MSLSGTPVRSRRLRLLSSALLSTLTAAVILPAADAQPVPADARGVPESFADLADRLLPSVVNISTSETMKGDSEDDDDGPENGPEVPDFPHGSPFEKFFHDYMNHPRNSPDSAPRHLQALGSGFIISADGYIVTNNHVIRHADRITVTLQDNTVLPAKIAGHDNRTDLALLKVTPPHPLPFVSFGNSDTARVGNWVLAIGNPFGLSGTVTAGIVSSRGRNIDQGPYDDFIQTDAAINKGNSGGPLFDMHGAVIGVNTAIYSPSGGSVGIGFSIPSNEVSRIITQLQKNGHVSRGRIGVRIQDVTRDIADGLNLSPARGALVAGVEPKGPAAAAGLETGDVVRQLNGADVTGKTLPRLIADLAPGTHATLNVWRKGKTLDLPVTIAALPDSDDDDAPAHPAPGRHDKTPDTNTSGFTVSSLTDEARKKYRLSDDQKGVVVTNVTEGSPAAERGLKPGDVITGVRQTPVSKPSDLRDALDAARKAKQHSVLLLVHDMDGMRWVPLPLDKDSH